MIEVVNTLKMPIKATHSRRSFLAPAIFFEAGADTREATGISDGMQRLPSRSSQRSHRLASNCLLQDMELTISHILNRTLMFLNDLPEEVAWLLPHVWDGHVELSP
ncbi:hypothetical protein [Paraburkholderia sacchari]|uniref:hypothetical protein n=1 Tax=Paraburkholderia sacchari TaxID=159450 RepID=UPI003D970C77